MKIKYIICISSYFLAVVCFMIAGFAIPGCIIYALYSWGVSEVALQVAVGSAVILFLKMIACVIPGFILLTIAGTLK